nr:restriction endonuclease subunit S [Magnetococcus marinus]
MKDEKKALVPRLRFPEFRDAGEWEKTTIGEIGKFYYGKSAPKWSLEEDAPTPCVRYGELYTKFGPIITETYSRTNIDPGKLRFSKGGEILVPRVGEKTEDFGKCCCYLPLGDIAIGEMISVFETAQNPLFYTYYFRRLYRQFSKVVEGQNVKNLYYVELEPLEIYRPPLTEQQKIADCLSSLDALIAAQADKIDALKTHKKGLIQQLFPREGKTVPRLRFPEFQEAGEWTEHRLENMAKRGSGHTPNKKFPSYYNGGIKWVSLADSNKLDDGYIYDTKVEISDDGINNSSAVLYPAGTVILSRDAGVGKSAVLYSPMAVSQHFMAWQCYENMLSNWFFYYLLQKLKATFESIAVGNAIKTIGAAYFKEMTITAPSLPEQQKIADCLVSLDGMIAAHTEKLDSLKTHKNGLMQQLFPSPEAVEA